MANTRTSRGGGATKRTERKKRIPVSGEGRNILAVENRDPNYHYRWVNDVEGRIDRFKDGWWELVSHNVTVGDRNIDTATNPDSLVTRKVGNNTTAYLMRIRKEYFEEDRASKQKHLDEIEESMFDPLNEKGPEVTGKVVLERK